MKATVTLEVGELAYIKDIIEGRHPANFWSDKSRTKLAIKLEKAIAKRIGR